MRRIGPEAGQLRISDRLIGKAEDRQRKSRDVEHPPWRGACHCREERQRQGQNLWGPSSNSGEAIVGRPNENGRGSVSTGTLESSNVDLAQQFTSVILAQRGFQSSSRVITAGDQMLQDLVNIIR